MDDIDNRLEKIEDRVKLIGNPKELVAKIINFRRLIYFKNIYWIKYLIMDDNEIKILNIERKQDKN